MGHQPIAVTIDGPAGAGKSTVARAVAHALGYRYIDTGALYRGVAWLAARRHLDGTDAAAVETMMDGMDLRLESDGSGARVWVDGTEVTAELRTPEISQLASTLSALPGVRARLVERQRAFGRQDSIVIEGRDTGTVIFPDAACKIYLDASIAERARRRLEDLRAAGNDATLEAVLADVRSRDERDMGREHAPLRPADDAHHVDTTGLSIAEVVERITARARAVEEQLQS